MMLCCYNQATVDSAICSVQYVGYYVLRVNVIQLLQVAKFSSLRSHLQPRSLIMAPLSKKLNLIRFLFRSFSQHRSSSDALHLFLAAHLFSLPSYYSCCCFCSCFCELITIRFQQHVFSFVHFFLSKTLGLQRRNCSITERIFQLLELEKETRPNEFFALAPFCCVPVSTTTPAIYRPKCSER